MIAEEKWTKATRDPTESEAGCSPIRSQNHSGTWISVDDSPRRPANSATLASPRSRSERDPGSGTSVGLEGLLSSRRNEIRSPLHSLVVDEGMS